MMAPDAARNTRVMFLGLFVGSAVLVAVAAQVISSMIADRAAFGAAVSPLFRYHALLGLGCSIAYLVSMWRDRTGSAERRRTHLILGGVILACVLGYFGMQPVMSALRAQAGGAVMDSSGRRLFGMLHGVLLLLYLVQASLALLLIYRETRKVAAP